MLNGTPSSDQNDLPSDRLAVFILGLFFFTMSGIVLLSNVVAVRGDLHVCRGPSGSLTVEISYWLNLAAGSFYIVQFALWWIGSRRPWDRPNPIAFSRQAWSGNKAWNDAIEKIGAAWRNDRLQLPSLFVLASNALAITIVIVTSAFLIGQLLACGSCPSRIDGKCMATIGAIAGSAGLMLVYYDMRIKFSGKPS